MFGGGGCKQHHSISFISFCATLPHHLHQNFISYYKNCQAQTLYLTAIKIARRRHKHCICYFLQEPALEHFFYFTGKFSISVNILSTFSSNGSYRNLLRNCAEIFRSVCILIVAILLKIFYFLFMISIIDIVLWNRCCGIILASNVCLAHNLISSSQNPFFHSTYVQYIECHVLRDLLDSNINNCDLS